MTMQVWAQRSGEVFILLPDDADRADVDMSTPGRILDTEQMELHPWMRAQTILAQGYWGEATASDLPRDLAEILDAVRVVPRDESDVPRPPSGVEWPSDSVGV